VMRKFNVILIILFALIACGRKSEHYIIHTNKIGGLFETSENGKLLKLYNKEESFKLNTATYIPFASFDKTFQKEFSEEGLVTLNFMLTKSGTLKFKAMTEMNIGKPICFVVENKIMAAPILLSVISEGKMSIMVSSVKEADEIVEYLKN
jgi:preprotein translocase subunit SecD